MFRHGVMWLVGVLAALAFAACGGGGGHDSADVHWPTATATGPVVVVPHLAGLNPNVALRRVRRLGLQWHAAFPGSAGNPAIQSGCSQVYNQAPAAGTHVRSGYTVSVTMAVCHGTIAQGEKVAHARGTGQSAGPYPTPH